MTLRIQCPSCSRKFTVSEELRGQTVECGGCEHRFKVVEGVIVRRREKFYPGERQRPGLEVFGTAGKHAAPPVDFQTANYDQQSSAEDFMPLTPQEMVAAGAGVIVLLLGAVLFFFGAQPSAFLQDVEIPRRALLGFFTVIVGAALLMYGARRRRGAGAVTTVLLGALVLTLAVFMPVHRTINAAGDGGIGGGITSPGEEPIPEKKVLTAEEVMELVGYGPVERAVTTFTTSDTDGLERVAALWVPTMEERFKYQIQKYLHRKAKTEERPSFYRRRKGGLFVLEGIDIPLEELGRIVERFGRVEQVYPVIRVVEIAVEGERLLEASPDLMSKLTDREHPAFYVRNLQELDHIDIDRVQSAVVRLSDAEPKRFRTEIAARLAQLLSEEVDAEFKGIVTRALMAWSEEGDGIEMNVILVAEDILGSGEEVPRSMLEFMTARSPEAAVPIVTVLWARAPSTWEPFVADLGSFAEEFVAMRLGKENRALQQSAVRLLKKIGTTKSLPALEAALPEAGTEFKLMLEDTIAHIRKAS
jgi:predicted Zn finger-like uncharacterized protein